MSADDTAPPSAPPDANLIRDDPPWWMQPALAALILIIFGGAVIASCFLGNETLKTTMFTATATLATSAAGFYFGSSAGSQRKDGVIAHTTQRIAAASEIPATETGPKP